MCNKEPLNSEHLITLQFLKNEIRSVAQVSFLFLLKTFFCVISPPQTFFTVKTQLILTTEQLEHNSTVILSQIPL